MGADGKMIHSSPAGCWVAFRPTRPEPSVVTASHAPARNWSMTMLKSSNVCKVIETPNACVAAVMFNSVVVPALVHTVSPSNAVRSEAAVMPSAARPMTC